MPEPTYYHSPSELQTHTSQALPMHPGQLPPVSAAPFIFERPPTQPHDVIRITRDPDWECEESADTATYYHDREEIAFSWSA